MSNDTIKKRGRPKRTEAALHSQEEIKSYKVRKKRQALAKELVTIAKKKLGEAGLPSDARHIFCTPIYDEATPKKRLPFTEFTQEHLDSIEADIAAGVRPQTAAILHSVSYVTLQDNYQHVIDKGLARHEAALLKTMSELAMNGSEPMAVFLAKANYNYMEAQHRLRIEQIDRHHNEKMVFEREKFEQQKKVDEQNRKNDEFKALMTDAFSKMQSFMTKPDDSE